MGEASARGGLWAGVLVSSALGLGGVGAFLLISAFGAGLNGHAEPENQVFSALLPPVGNAAPLGILLALVTVIAASRALGALFRLIHQPPVIGEVLAGILLGPTLFGRLAPEVAATILPSTVVPGLGVLAQLGVLLYMFVVGLGVDTDALRGKLRAALTISQASIVAPFLMGSAFALWLYPRFGAPGVPFGVFAMFMGLAMSVTAFPVLARILSDSNLLRTRLGVLAVGCAALGDVIAWCLLALTVGVAGARPQEALGLGALTLGYIGFMLLLVGPLLKRLTARQDLSGRVSGSALSTALLGLLLSALTTELIGIHALFGAFLLGAVVPHDSLLAKELSRRLEEVVKALLLPAFFALIGLKTQIGLLSSGGDWLVCALIILIACAGKLGGTAIAGRLCGLGTRDAVGLGVLMNTRGLMELIVLEVGLDMKVISPKLFAMMVIMALVTTLLTAPLLHYLMRGTSLSDPELSTARG